MRFSPVLAVIVGGLLAVPSSAAANGTTATSKKVAGASASVSSCGTLSGIGIAWTVTNDAINSVSLTSIPAACNGGSLSITFVNGSNVSQGSAGPVTITGTSQTINSITGSPVGSNVASAFASVVGP